MLLLKNLNRRQLLSSLKKLVYKHTNICFVTLNMTQHNFDIETIKNDIKLLEHSWQSHQPILQTYAVNFDRIMDHNMDTTIEFSKLCYFLKKKLPVSSNIKCAILSGATVHITCT